MTPALKGRGSLVKTVPSGCRCRLSDSPICEEYSKIWTTDDPVATEVVGVCAPRSEQDAEIQALYPTVAVQIANDRRCAGCAIDADIINARLNDGPRTQVLGTEADSDLG